MGMTRRAGDTLAAERHIVVNMAGRESGAFDEKHLNAQQNHAHGYDSYG